MFWGEKEGAWPVPNCLPKAMPSISTLEYEQLQPFVQ